MSLINIRSVRVYNLNIIMIINVDYLCWLWYSDSFIDQIVYINFKPKFHNFKLEVIVNTCIVFLIFHSLSNHMNNKYGPLPIIHNMILECES